MKTKETIQAEKALYAAIHRMGVATCFEVTIGWAGRERVDCMTIDTKDVIRCYEVKVSKPDFHSDCKLSFVGDYNYFVLPEQLYKEVQGEIPPEIGVYVVNEYGHAICQKKAKRQSGVEREKLKSYMIRSLDREVSKEIKSADPRIIEGKDRQIAQLTRRLRESEKELWHYQHAIVKNLGREWLREHV